MGRRDGSELRHKDMLIDASEELFKINKPELTLTLSAQVSLDKEITSQLDLLVK